MQRRIIDVWRDLVGHPQRDPPDQLDEGQPLLRGEVEAAQRRQEMESIYRNLSWTRLVSMQHDHDPENQQWPIAPDIIENQEIIQAMEE